MQHFKKTSENIIKLIKLRRIRWEEHVVQMREKRNACRILVGKLGDATKKTKI
jgi:hypothetical protein